MFEDDLTSLTTADLLESAAAHRAEVNRLDARLLEHAQIYADRYHPDACPTRPGRGPADGRERAVVLGGDGCPEIAEFAPAEFGVMIGISAGAAADYIGQALALRHRFPFTWARVLAGEATPWKARKIAAACLELSQEAAKAVDKRVAKVVDSLTPGRLDKIVEAAKMHADPERARAKAEEKKRERGVYVSRSDEHGTKRIFIRTGSGDAIRFNARISSIAEALKMLGDTSSLQTRRADAVGIIADPRYTEELLHQAHQLQANTPPTPLPATTSSPDPMVAAPTTRAGDLRSPSQSRALATPTPAADANQATAPPDLRGSTPTAGPTVGRSPSTTPDLTGDPRRHQAADPNPAADHPQAADPHQAIPGQGAGGAGSGCIVHEDLRDEWAEPDPHDEADRDAPHPSDTAHPDPLDTPFKEVVEPFDPAVQVNPADDRDGVPLDPAERRALDTRLAQIKHDAHTNPHTGRHLRPGQTEIYIHLTDQTLATGTGVLRAEDLGPLLATQLTELIGHSPYTVKPVIDLNDAISVDAYEIPNRIRERVRLIHPVELFPYGTRETHPAMDLDHIQPYDPLGPPAQTTPTNLAPLRRFPHRVKTHGHWKVRRLDHKTLQWLTPNGFAFHVDPTGTHRA